MNAPLIPTHCVCEATDPADPTAAEHAVWCPARKPTPERIREITAGTGRPLMAGELAWLRGDASRAELHISGAAAGAFPLSDNLPAWVAELGRKLGAVVAELDRTRTVLKQSENDLTGARLSLWEEEQQSRQLLRAWRSARMRSRRKAAAARVVKTRLAAVHRSVEDTLDFLASRDTTGWPEEAIGLGFDVVAHLDGPGPRADEDVAARPALPWMAFLVDVEQSGLVEELASLFLDYWRGEREVERLLVKHRDGSQAAEAARRLAAADAPHADTCTCRAFPTGVHRADLHDENGQVRDIVPVASEGWDALVQARCTRCGWQSRQTWLREEFTRVVAQTYIAHHRDHETGACAAEAGESLG